MRVLIPVDGSERSDRILSVIDRLPQLRGSELVVVQVVPGPDPEREPGAVDLALEHLRGIARRQRSTGLRVEPLVVVGDAAEEVLRLARLVQPALVAMAMHGTGASAALRGAVAERVLERCPAPLLLCNDAVLPLDPTGGFNRILVPLDGSSTSALVLDPVEEIAQDNRSEVLLLHVDPQGERAEDALSELEGPRRRLVAAGVKVRALPALGDPATAIVDAAARENVDLLAMTSHSHSGTSRQWFGSVAGEVVRHVPCPLLVVRVARPAG